MMYYRGTRVSLSEKEARFHSSRPQRKEGEGKSLFLKFFEGKGGPQAPRRDQEKVYAFYRPGMTPTEDVPAFSKKTKSWGFQAPSWKGTKWLLRAAALAVLVLAVIWSKNKTTALLQDVAGLKLSRVTVEGNHYLTDEQVVRAAGLPLGENMFKLDLEEATRKVSGLDWARSVFLERRLPQSILISVKERTPVALLDAGELYGVDGEGRILSPSDALLREDLPLVSGVALKAESVGTTLQAEALRPALAFLGFLKRKDGVLAQEVSEVNLSDPDSLRVTFIDGIVATFNPEVTEQELKRMAMVLSDLNQKNGRAGTMDFRYRDMVLVKTR